MHKREINPTDWLQVFNINHAIEVTGGQSESRTCATLGE